jgi:hypothetical protein
MTQEVFGTHLVSPGVGNDVAGLTGVYGLTSHHANSVTIDYILSEICLAVRIS